MYKYTICFITRGDDVLMLNRNFTPNMGLWNGAGGKLQNGETPEQCILREVEEETGIQLHTVSYCGTVAWTADGKDWGGMYLYTAHIDTSCEVPHMTREGILAWKPLSWVLNEQNSGVVSNIRHFLPHALRGSVMQHRCYYRHGQLVEVISAPLPVPNHV